MKTEIFVLNYNGSEILLECLPSILEAGRAAGCPVTVIDNSSTDDSLKVLEERFPEANVRVFPNRVLCSFNDAVKDSKAEVVLLLNNDLKVEKDFVRPLVEVFKNHPEAFLAAPKAYTFDGGRYEGSLSKMTFTAGLLKSESRFPGYEAKVDRPGYTMQSGFGAFRRAAFVELGGFDDLYLPGTVEDCDLAFRAWRAGWACYYVPASRVLHKGQATFRKNFSRSRLLALNQRNLYLFIWKNIDDKRLWAAHLLWLLPRPLFFLLKGRIEFLWGFLWAFGRLPAALARRFKRYGHPARSDQEIFAISRAI